MNAEFIFSDKMTADSSIIIDDASKTEVFYNDLKHADNSCKFKIPYSITLVNRIKADLQNNVKCFVKNDDDSNYFCGYIRKTISFEKTQQNQPVSLELVSPSFLLDKTLDKGAVYISKTVTEIVTDLLSKAGFTDIKSIDITDTISVCTFTEDDNIKDVVDELLQEYQKTYDFDNNGYFYTADILNVPETDTVTQKFTGDNIRESIKIEAKERDADYVEAEWNKIEYKENTLIFSDTSGQTSDYKCKITISAGKYFAGTQYNYLTYDSSLGTVVYVTDVTPKITADKGISYSVTRTDEDGNDLGTSCMLTAHNNTEDDLEINQLDIYGNAYINTGTNKNVSSTGTKKKALTINYLHDEDSVKAYVAAVANYYRYACNTITFKSTLNFSCGTFVSVTDYGIGTYYGRIVKKTSRLDTKAIEYEVETISDFTPAAVSSTKTNYNGANASRFSGFSDFTAPSVPVISSAVIDTNGWTTITITPSTDTESGVSYYKLYRKEGSETFSVLTMLNHTGSNISYVDKAVRKGFSYSYCVSAVDKVGNTSALSAEKSITAKVTAAPNPATGLTAVANTDDYIKLAWTAAVADSDENRASYYIVSISRDGGKTWTVCSKTNDVVYYYYYDRTIDKYPEKSVLQNYKFRLETVSINSISSGSYAVTPVDCSSYGTWIPTAPTVKAAAEEDGIRLTWTDSSSGFYGNVSYVPVISYSGTARTTGTTKEKTYFYTFDRTVDKYPERSTLTGAAVKLNGYSIAVKAVDEKSGNSTTGTAVTPDESSYGQWQPSQPVIQSTANGRNIVLVMAPADVSINNRKIKLYGTYIYRIQIKRLSATADTVFYKPDLSADSYSSDTAYKVAGDTGYVTTVDNTFSQTLPLAGQSASPAATSYQYSIISENEAGAGTTAALITVSAVPTGTTDIVNQAISESKMGDKSVTARTLAAFDLAATNAYVSKIAGNKGGSPDNFWRGLDTATPEFRIGNGAGLEAAGSEDAEYVHYKPGTGLLIKLKTFIITSLASIIKGVFWIKSGVANSTPFFVVNPESGKDSSTGVPAQTVKIAGTLQVGKITCADQKRYIFNNADASAGSINEFGCNDTTVPIENYFGKGTGTGTITNAVGRNESTGTITTNIGENWGTGTTANIIGRNQRAGRTEVDIGRNTSTGSIGVEIANNMQGTAITEIGVSGSSEATKNTFGLNAGSGTMENNLGCTSESGKGAVTNNIGTNKSTGTITTNIGTNNVNGTIKVNIGTGTTGTTVITIGAAGAQINLNGIIKILGTLSGNIGGNASTATTASNANALGGVASSSYIYVTAHSFTASNSYIKFSNGLLMQWLNIGHGTGAVKNITLPLAYTAVTSYAAFKQFNRYTSAGDSWAQSLAAIPTSAQVVKTYCDNASTNDEFLFTIGY